MVGSLGIHVFLPWVTWVTRFWVSICCSGLAVGLSLVAAIHFPRVWLKVDPFWVDLDLEEEWGCLSRCGLRLHWFRDNVIIEKSFGSNRAYEQKAHT